MAKSTDAEVARRVAIVQDELLNGYTRHHIIRYASEWSVTERTIEEYMARATANIMELNKLTYEENLAQVSGAWWNLFRTGDEKTKATALTNLAKIRGLDQISINHFLKDERALADKTDAELDELLGGTDATSSG